MIKKLFFLTIVALLALTASANTRRSTIHLKSGEVVTGVITSRDEHSVEILVDDDMKYVYTTDEIAYISHEARKKNYDTSKFRGFIDLGYAFGFGSPRNDYWLIETSFGYQFNTHFYLGAGLGMHPFRAEVSSYPLRTDKAHPEPNDPDWDFPFIPIYLEGRYNWRSETHGTPFASLKLGCGTFNHSGLFAAPTVGYHFGTSQYFSFNIGVGYELHTASYKQWVTGDTPGCKPDLSGHSYLKRTPLLHNAVVKLGVEF